MYLLSGSGTLTTALCPSCPAILPSGTSIPKQHRSNRFVHTLHTASSQDGHDVHRTVLISFRYRQSPNRIQTQRVCSNRAATGPERSRTEQRTRDPEITETP